MKDKWLIVIVGPTAIGKTACAIALAKHFGTEIFSADSRQFYQEMTIGTAKPTTTELATVPHHFINNISIHTKNYSAGKYEAEAIAALDDFYKKNNTAILVGGSGLFVRAVCTGFDELEKNNNKDHTTRDFLNQQPIEWLQNELERLDPTYFAIVDKKNPIRLKRALEVIYSTGKKYSEQRIGVKKERIFNVIKIGLQMEREMLYERINNRVELMLKEGLEEEVKALYIHKKLNALNTVGYQEFFDYFEGNITKEEAINLIKQNTRQYAKRQLTWFKKEEDIRWFAPDEISEMITFISTTMQHEK